MSRKIFEKEPYGTILVQSYAGPAGTDSATRMRIELHVHDKYDSLSYEEARELRDALDAWLKEHAL